MSSIPQGGVVIPIVADLSQVHAALAEIRRQSPIALPFVPASSGYTGPSGGPTGAPTGIGGPSTFSNPAGGAFNWSSASSANYIGPGGASPLAGAGGAQLGQAATQLTQAAAAMNQAAQAMGAAAARGTPGGGGSSGIGGGGDDSSSMLNTRGLARYASAGFAAHELLNVGSAFRSYVTERSMAAGDPAGTARAELGLYDKVAGVPLFGQVAGVFADPTGSGRLAAEQTMASASLQDSIGEGKQRIAARSLALSGQASISGATGAERSRLQAQYEFDGRERAIRRERDEQSAKLAEQSKQDRQAIADRLGAANDKLFGASKDDMARYQRDANTQFYTDADRKQNLETSLAPQRADSEQIRQNELRDIHESLSSDAERYSNQADRYRANAGYIDRAALRQIDRSEADRQYRDIRRKSGGTVADEFMGEQNAKWGEEDAAYNRGNLSTRIGLSGGAMGALQGAAGNSFGAHLTRIATQLDQFLATNQNASLVGPQLANSAAQYAAVGISAAREFGFQYGPGGQVDFATQAANAITNHNPLQARLLANDAQRQQALRATDGVPSLLRGFAQWGVNREFDARKKAYTTEESDAIDRASFGIQSDTQRLRIYNNPNVDPAVRAAQSHVFGINSNTQQQAMDAFKSGRGSLVPDIYARGEEQQKAFANDYMKGFQSEEVDPTRTALNGSGTEDIVQILRTMSEGIKKMENVPQTLDDIASQLTPR
jgi:hypothetical protein